MKIIYETFEIFLSQIYYSIIRVYNENRVIIKYIYKFQNA